MKVRSTMLVLGISMLAAGCATPPTVGGSPASLNPDCPQRADLRQSSVVCLQNGVACGIPVQVVTGTSGACEVAVATDVLQMRRDPGNPTGLTTIYWWLAGSGKWEFRAEGSPFTAPAIFKDANASTQFSPAVVWPGGDRIEVTNRNRDRNKYEYSIKVYKRDSQQSIKSPDPAIYNDGD